MKKIIDRKIYDTEKATKIAEAEAKCNRCNFDYWEEELYRTPNGRYFIVGRGHAKTHWASHYDNTSSWGEGLEARDDDEVIGWLEYNEFWDVLEREFPGKLKDA